MKIGIDLGGTKIEAVVIDDHGSERFRRRVDTPSGDYDGVLRAIRGLVEAAESELKITGCSVGVGTPGVVSPSSGLVKNSNTVCLIGKRLDADLQAALRRPVRLANDANCFALSEATDGAAAGVATVFGVIIGTGTGGGVVIDKQVLRGANAIAGEWGHNPLPWPEPSELPGPRCYCGKHGCIETYLSGPGLERAFTERTGMKMKAEKIGKGAVEGETQCVSMMTLYVDRLARALATVINVIDPEVIVMGGGVSNIDLLYQRVPEVWGKYVFSDHVATKIVRAKHGDSSGVRGAAFLW